VIGNLIGAIIGYKAHLNAGGFGPGKVYVVVADAIANDGCAWSQSCGRPGGELGELDHGDIGAGHCSLDLFAVSTMVGDELRASRPGRRLFRGQIRKSVIGNDDTELRHDPPPGSRR
jgi:hypothetical protein